MTTPLPVIITPNAADDQTASWTYLRDRNPRAADEWLAGIRDTILAGSVPAWIAALIFGVVVACL